MSGPVYGEVLPKTFKCEQCGMPVGYPWIGPNGLRFCSIKCLEEYRSAIESRPIGLEPMPDPVISPPVSPLRESLDDIAGSIVEMLVRKNTDYGDSYRRLRDEFGPDSFLIRLGDKYNRLIALRGKEALVSETTDDTIRDIVGYCLLEMVYRRGEAE